MEGQYCVDLLNNTVLPSKIYSPGPDPCTSCTCDNGAPSYCKVITCATPKNCRLVHPHTTCCNFECHENMDLTEILGGTPMGGGGGSNPERTLSFNELTLRFVLITFTVFISMSILAFLIHRLKKRKLRGHQPRPLGVEDNRIGYIEGSIRGSIRYLPEYVAYEPPHAALWKPHGYFPAGEAPPPYEEAVAAARAEAALQTLPTDTPSLGIVSTVTMPYHRTIPLNLLSGNSHATTTTTAVIVRSNVHYDTLPQASQTNAIENIRHPSLSRNSTSTGTTISSASTPPPLASSHPTGSSHSSTHTTGPAHIALTPGHTLSGPGHTHLDLAKSPSYQPSPKTPSGASKHKLAPGTPGSKGNQGSLNSSGGSNVQNIYANVPSPVSTTTSFIGATSKEQRTSYAHNSQNVEKYDKVSHHTDKAHKDDRLCKSGSYKYEKCDRVLEPKMKQHDYVYVTKAHESKTDAERVGPNKSEQKFHENAHHIDHAHHGEHAHHSHKKHKKQVQLGTNTVQRNLTMPKSSKQSSKTGPGKNLHTNYLALEKQYEQILKNGLKTGPGHSQHTANHSSRSGGARASVSTISSNYVSHHTTIPNYFTSPSLPPPSDVIKPPSIYKSSTTPTLLSHLSNSNPILSMSLDSNDEDYIDECENCRSDVIPSCDDPSRMGDLETMTLQRSRPNCYEDFTEEKFASTSLTLPTHCRVQRPSPMNNGPPPVINRFSSILSQSSLSEEDD